MGRADMGKQAFGGGLGEIEHMLEALGAAIVGVRNFVESRAGGEFEKKPEPGFRAVGAQPGELAQVRAIHGEHVIETLEILPRHLPAAQVRDVHPAPLRRRARARIGRVADVIIVGSGGIGRDRVAEPFAGDAGAKYALGGGRAADVAETDEKNADHNGFRLGHRGLSSKGPAGSKIATMDREKRIVVLTGAGISRESGLSTFRDADGIWSRVRIEDVATPEAFRRDPARVHDFYNRRRRALLDPAIRPNPAHDALARLEAEWPAPVLIVTQNIDDLHERAGSRNLLHMHGELLKARCAACGDARPWLDDLGVDVACPACGRAGGLRPHVVWFGEMPFHMDDINAALDRCALFVSIGTSGAVYPAAGFVARVRERGFARTVELNLEPSEGATLFEESDYGPASVVVPAFVQELLGRRS